MDHRDPFSARDLSANSQAQHTAKETGQYRVQDAWVVRHGTLTRIIHEASTAAADPGMSTALRSVGFLDVLSSTPAESSRRAPCIHARLHRLATNLHE